MIPEVQYTLSISLRPDPTWLDKHIGLQTKFLVFTYSLRKSGSIGFGSTELCPIWQC